MTRGSEVEPLAVACPGCCGPGKPVRPVTLRALLKPDLVAGVADADYRFCAATGCDVVYYGPSWLYTRDQLAVAVGVKEAAGDRPLCYCYGHSVASIKEELRTKGRSDALEDIRRRMAGCGCACERTNPAGTCCLGAVARGVEVARAELYGPGPTPAPGRRGIGAEALTKAGAALSAVLATSCCWLPFLLLACGVSGAGVAAAMETYRPVFLAVTVAFLAAAFYLAYRPRPAGAGHDCCAATPRRGNATRMQTLNRATLWAATLLAVVAFAFPKGLAALVGDAPATGTAMAGQEARTTTFAVSEMNCEGCSALVARALRKVPGVRGVDVDYPAARVVVASDADAPAPTEAVLSALDKAGFPGEVVGEK
jgi:copper chaperone CopZ